MTSVANFSVEYSQFLDSVGKLTQELPEFASHPDKLLHAYHYMQLTRIFDAKAVALQRTGKMGTFPSSLGQEAVTVGVGNMMEVDDVICPTYRETGALLIRGVKMSEIFAYWGGDEVGSAYVNDKVDFPITVPIASQCLHATGVATAMKLKKQKRVAVSVCGDGATSKGDFYEALNLAGAWKLPVVFIVNNNQWAISVPRAKQTATQTLAQKAIAAGFSGIQVDGNDLIAVQHASHEALEKARNGGGPTLIEAITYRLDHHTTADDATRYREDKELNEARKLEPFIRLRQYLESIGVWDEKQEKQLKEQCSAKVEAAVKEYQAMPKPTIESMFDYLYETVPESLQEQRQMAIELAGL